MHCGTTYLSLEIRQSCIWVVHNSQRIATFSTNLCRPIPHTIRCPNTPSAEAVVALARVYGRSPVEALVAAGYLSSSELGVVELTTLTGDLTGVSIDSLLS
jgi:hypothetical protein